MNNDLNKKAMLVDLSIRMWLARKYDKKVTAEVAVAHGTDEDVGRYNKNLLPIDSPSYDAVRKLGTALRMEHYQQTLPWSNEGARILPAARYVAYMEKMREMRAQYDKATSAFLAEYPALRENSKTALKGMYRDEDYPSEAYIGEHFEVSIKVFPLPVGDDFRVDLANGTQSDVQEQITKDTRDAINEAMKEPYRRLHVIVARMAERLNDPKAKFKNSLVGNIEELCDILPTLNLTDDPEMAKMTDVVRAKLGGHDPDVLRKDKKVRKQVAAEASRIESDLAGFMGGGG